MIKDSWTLFCQSHRFFERDSPGTFLSSRFESVVREKTIVRVRENKLAARQLILDPHKSLMSPSGSILYFDFRCFQWVLCKNSPSQNTAFLHRHDR